MIRRLEIITLPLRAGVLLVLLGFAYYFGVGAPSEDWRTESERLGVVARYSRDGRPWRIYYDTNRDRRWDMWIDERGGPPLLVSIDTNGDGVADVNQDEFGSPVPRWRSAQIRAAKTAGEFFRNPLQLQYTAVAMMLYVLLEFLIRSYAS
jgi:hypothetical protein